MTEMWQGGVGFQNAPIDQSGRLLVPSVQSDNYVAGVSGWKIAKDGSAEFQDATMRGVFFVTDGDNEVRISATNPPWTFDPAVSLNPGVTAFAPALVQSSDFNSGRQGDLYIRSPYPADPSGPTPEGDPAEILMRSDDTSTPFVGKFINMNADNVNVSGGLDVNGGSLDVGNGNDLNVTGDVAVTGGTTIQNDLQVNGNSTIAGTTTFGDMTVLGDVINVGDNVGVERMFRSFANTTRTNTTTMIDINGWSMAVAANAFYTFDSYLEYQSTSAADNLSFRFTGPGDAFWNYVPDGINFDVSTGAGAIRRESASSSRQIGTVAGTSMILLTRGYLSTVSAGTFKGQFAQGVATPGVTLTCVAGSYIRIKRWQ